MTLFLTGCSGFLGSTVARVLLAKGYQIRAIRRATSSMDLVADIEDQIDWMRGDVLDPESLEHGMEGVDGVFHCAAFLGFEGKKSERQLMRINVEGTANVVDAALSESVARFLHVSSIAAIGRVDGRDNCLDETANWNASNLNTAYAVSKHRAELEIHRGIAMGLDAVIVNPSLVMGPGRLGENTMQIAENLKSRSIPVLPKGATNVVDVEDVAIGALKAFQSGRTGERYLLSGHNMLWQDIFSQLAAALGVEPPSRQVSRPVMTAVAIVSEFFGMITRSTPLITRETARLSMSMSCYDNTKAKTELGCEFRNFELTAARIASVFEN